MKNDQHEIRTLNAPSHAVTLTPTAIAYLLRGRPAGTVRVRVPQGSGLRICRA
ncbi:MAG: hypothetical protein WAV52_12220 [Luteococcus japonicus]|uniref:hypothetical protein n=1 Tax=Luteococcus sp. TaxID=1969402 RepID=UPI002648BFB7|nr:hypothetical protein [Luteococcus sp.]MDN5562263.1 hypothetical protein [Luteococcus sp.]